MTDIPDEVARRDGPRANRRLFLKGAGVAAVAAPIVAQAETLVKPTNHQTDARYKDSEHVQRFYALNRR